MKITTLPVAVPLGELLVKILKPVSDLLLSLFNFIYFDLVTCKQPVDIF